MEKTTMNTGVNSDELVALCLSGDEDAWGKFVEEYRDLVYGICYYRSRSAHDAEDLMQEACLKIWTNLGAYDPARGALRAWVSAVTRNVTLDRYRRESMHRATESIDEALNAPGVIAAGEMIDRGPTPLEIAASSQMTGFVLKEARKIPPEMWEIMRMKFLHELDNHEIAKKLRIPEGTVKSRVSRGRAHLAVLLRPLSVAFNAA
ncbi:MAG: sigma-70 family RNA polymerase sigma factor [Terracidiphilus sp.]